MDWEREPRSKKTGLLVRVVFEKTGCEMGEPEGSVAGIYLPLPVAALNFVDQQDRRPEGRALWVFFQLILCIYPTPPSPE